MKFITEAASGSGSEDNMFLQAMKEMNTNSTQNTQLVCGSLLSLQKTVEKAYDMKPADKWRYACKGYSGTMAMQYSWKFVMQGVIGIWCSENSSV